VREPVSNLSRLYKKKDVLALMGNLFESETDKEISNFIKPDYEYTVLELFAALWFGRWSRKSGLKMYCIK
jgi:DNA (cytosine-5)-methyltransferase 1